MREQEAEWFSKAERVRLIEKVEGSHNDAAAADNHNNNHEDG